MNMTDIREKVYDILSEVLGDEATGVYCYEQLIDYDEGDGFYSSVGDEDLKFLIEGTDDVTVYYGASRVVLYPENEDFVIKLPITGIFSIKYTFLHHTEDEGDVIEEIWTGEESDSEIWNNYFENPDYEYQSQEIFKIKEIRESCDLMDMENAYREEATGTLQQLLVPNTYVGKWNGIPVYIQKKVATVGFHYIERTEEEIKILNDIIRELKEKVRGCIITSDNFAASLVEKYGMEATINIYNEINDLGITDLHCSNVGYFKDGTPCIFDYAGYDEEEIWEYV